MHRRASAWFGASFLLACVASLGAGALVRDHLRIDQSFWLVSPVIYVVRDQHLRALVPFLTPTLTLVLWLPLAIAIVILVHNVRVGTTGVSALPEIVAGLFIGGGLANVLEAQMIGSVTDFIGIHRMGTYSAGDIAFDVASSLLPIAVIQIARAQHQTFTHVLQAGTAFYVAVVLFAVASQDYALAILATLVMGISAATSLTKRMTSPKSPSR
jgi:signal peptidase (SPase) II